MSTTRPGTGNDTAETHETAVREYLRSHGAIAEPTHLTVGSPVRKTGTAAA